MKILKRISDKVLMAVLIAAIVICNAPAIQAQDDGEVARPVATMFTVDLGAASVRDTYLTPITYHGTHMRLGFSAMQATGFNPEQWVRHLELGAEYDLVHNRPGNNTMHNLMVDGRWSMMRRWRHSSGMQLMAGGMIGARGGAIYNPSNSNNVASVKVHLGVGLAGAIIYPVHIKRLPVTLNWTASFPLIGVTYSPDYDESYYEMYVGNHSNLVHPAWPGNRLEFNSLLSADLHLGNTILRVGVRGHSEAMHINNLRTGIFNGAVVLGLGGDFLNIGRNKQPKRVISSMY